MIWYKYACNCRMEGHRKLTPGGLMVKDVECYLQPFTTGNMLDTWKSIVDV